MRYRPEIDGLRAVAVLPVILFHAGIAGFEGGFVGVDVFFVISGYLITSIIINELQKQRFTISNFYERRARRILPALFVVLVATIPPAWTLFTQTAMENYSESLIATLLFGSNFYFWLDSGYFAGPAELKPLLHTWSLSIEEQFYVFFPLLLAFVWRFRAKNIILLLALAGLTSLLASQWAAYHKEVANFFLLPTRAWELLLGACVALVTPSAPGKTSHGLPKNVVSLVGLVLIAIAVTSYSPETPFPGFYALLPTLGTALILLYGNQTTLTGRLLAAKPLVGIGLISYSAYLWHQPIFAYTKYVAFPKPSIALMLALSVLSLGLAYVTWRFVEIPFRKRDLVSRPRLITSLSLVGTLLFTFATIAVMSNGLPNRQIVKQFDYLDYQPDNDILRQHSYSKLRDLSGDPNYKHRGNPFDWEPWFSETEERPKMLVVGDSHSKDLYNVLSSSKCVTAHIALARFGVSFHALTPKFYSSPNYLQSDMLLIASRYSKEDFPNLNALVTEALGDGKHVMLVRNIFEFSEHGDRTLADVEIQEALSRAKPNAAELADRVNKAYYDEYSHRARRELPAYSDQQLDLIARRHPEVRVLDRMDYICNHSAQRCDAVNDRLNKYFYDYGHHTLLGASFFGKKIDDSGWAGFCREGGPSDLGAEE